MLTTRKLKYSVAALSVSVSLSLSLISMAQADVDKTTGEASGNTSELAIPQQTVSLAGAERVMAAALKEARSNGWVITVAVVDNSGELVTLVRDDNAIAISPSVAIGKAKTAALLRKPSKAFEDYINDHNKPSFLATPGVTPLEGGVPLFLKDGSFVGAVGISGAHGPNDSRVAEAAAAALL